MPRPVELPSLIMQLKHESPRSQACECARKHTPSHALTVSRHRYHRDPTSTWISLHQSTCDACVSSRIFPAGLGTSPPLAQPHNCATLPVMHD